MSGISHKGPCSANFGSYVSGLSGQLLEQGFSIRKLPPLVATASMRMAVRETSSFALLSSRTYCGGTFGIPIMCERVRITRGPWVSGSGPSRSWNRETEKVLHGGAAYMAR